MKAKQTSLFDFPKVEIKNKIRLIELFGGIGSQAMALRDIGADFEHYRLVEFDKYAVASYNAIHGTSFETADIRNVHGADIGIVERETFTYIMTYSFPCTDLSVAGKMKGMSKAEWENGNSTRSGLLWEVERILKELAKEQLPQVCLMENVPQVHAEQNMADFKSWLAFLRDKGYHNFYKDLNAKDYGIPQNRNRCFMVSVLSDDFIEYEFPEGIRLEKVMKNFLEDEVDEKYYINSEKAKKLIDDLISRGELKEKNCIDIYNNRPIGEKLCGTITANGNTSSTHCGTFGIVEKEVKIIGQMDNTIDHTFESANRVYDKEQLCPTIPTCAGGNIQPKIIEETRCVGGLSEKKWGDKRYHQQDRDYKGDIALAQPANLPGGSYKYIVAMRGRNPERPTDRTAGLPTEQRLEPAPQGIVNTLTTVQKDNMVLETKIKKVGQISNEGSQCGTVVSDEGLAPTLSAGTHGYANAHIATQYRIRKLTPRECWRLMGYTDADFDKAEKVNSSTQLYKQAGNAIVKQVLMAIFAQMIPASARGKNGREQTA